MDKKIIIYGTCCTTNKATKYYHNLQYGYRILPLAIRIEDEKMMNFFLNTGYYKRLPYDMSPDGMFLGDYLVYDYLRNQPLKDKGEAPEFIGIMEKDRKTGKKYVLKNVEFYNNMECNLYSTNNVDSYDIQAETIQAINADIFSRVDNNNPRKLHFILDGSYPFSQARKYFKKGIYPLHITKDASMTSSLTGPYKEDEFGNYKFFLIPGFQYDYLIKEEDNEPYFYEIVNLDPKTNLLSLDENNETYSIDAALEIIRRQQLER